MWDRSKTVHTVQAGEGDPAATIGISDMVARLGHDGNRNLGGGWFHVGFWRRTEGCQSFLGACSLAGWLARSLAIREHVRRV